MLTKKVTFIAKDDTINELKELLTMMVKPSQKEEGCLLYHIYQSKQQATKFVVIESWESEKALEGHKTTDHYKHYKSHFEPYAADKYSEDLDEL